MGGRGRSRLWIAVAAAVGAAAAPHARAQSIDDLRRMSIQQLENTVVTSVSKRRQPLSEAAAAAFVITHDDIVRSGATNLAQILRLDPNLQVAHIDANSHAITARGFNGNAADKLLVLIDGRSVYTPLFGGVFWDEQDVLPEDIERIEVIDGPGATLWGANAVNGVINIITRTAADTQGGLVELQAGNRETRGALQYGGALADDLNYRVYAEHFTVPHDRTSSGVPAHDGWSRGQGGFRLDWTPPGDTVTLEGDLYRGDEQNMSPARVDISGGDLQLNWRRDLGDDASFQVVSYFDEQRRFTSLGGYSLQTYDVEFQHTLPLGSRQTVVWGAGYRAYQDHFVNYGSVVYLPPSSLESVADVFGQDTLSISDSLDLILGLKFEKDSYAGIATLPTARLSWKPTPDILVWAAASRAVRAPTLFDEDLKDTLVPGVVVLTGNRRFLPEWVTAYEVGARAQIGAAASISASAYYNVYDNLRSVEFAPTVRPPLVLEWGNMMQGHTDGLEVWGDYRPTRWWRLTAGFNLMHEALRFKPGASAVNNLGEAGDDPGVQASVASNMNLGRHLSWHADLRYVGALPHPHIASYVELDTNLIWTINERVQLLLSGRNLLHAQHLEYEEAGAPFGYEVERSVSVGTRLRF